MYNRRNVFFACAGFLLLIALWLILRGRDIVLPEDIEPVAMEAERVPDLPEAESEIVPTLASEPPTRIPEKPTRYQLLVRVFTREGVPAPGAEVHLSYYSAAGQDVDPKVESIPVMITDDRGEGTQYIAEPGRYVAMCRWNDQAAPPVRFNLGYDTIAFVDIVLRPASIIAGRTVDSVGGALPGVAVSLGQGPNDMETVVSGEDGRFQFSEAVPLPAMLRGELKGYAPALLTHMDSGKEAVLVMSRGGQLVATVLEADTVSPMRGFPLELRGVMNSGLPDYRAISDARGIATIEWVTPGEYDLVSGDKSLALSEARETVTVVSGEATRIDVLVESGSTISGRVFDSETGAGIPGLRVQFMILQPSRMSMGEAITDRDGSYRRGPLPAGNYSVGILGVPREYGSQFHEHAISEMRSLDLSAGEDVEEFDFALQPREPFGGRVEFSDGTPAPGAEVHVAVLQPTSEFPNGAAWFVKTTAGPDGRFAIYDVPADEPVTLHARWRGFESTPLGPVEVAVVPPEGVVLTLTKGMTGTLAGQVVDFDGSPIQAHVKAVALKDPTHFDQEHWGSTDEEGFFLFTDVAAGDYEFHFGARRSGRVDYTDADSGPYTLEAGQVRTGIQLRLSDGGLTLSGIVREANGDPVRSYKIEVEPLSGAGFLGASRKSTYTDNDGRFQFNKVPEGLYELYIGQSGSQGYGTHRAQAGEEIEIVLPGPED